MQREPADHFIEKQAIFLFAGMLRFQGVHPALVIAQTLMAPDEGQASAGHDHQDAKEEQSLPQANLNRPIDLGAIDAAHQEPGRTRDGTTSQSRGNIAVIHPFPQCRSGLKPR